MSTAFTCAPSAQRFAHPHRLQTTFPSKTHQLALCAPTSAIPACFPDHQPPPAQHHPSDALLATSPCISPGRSTHSLSHIQAIFLFCLTMPQAPWLLVWFLTLPSQIARAALRRIGGKPPCPLAICSLVRFTETKQRRLLATKSNQKRRN